MADNRTQQAADQMTDLIEEAQRLADRLDLGLTAIYLEQALNSVASEMSRS